MMSRTMSILLTQQVAPSARSRRSISINRMTKHHHCKKTPTIFTLLYCLPLYRGPLQKFYISFLGLLDPVLELGVGVLQNHSWLTLLESDALVESLALVLTSGASLKHFLCVVLLHSDGDFGFYLISCLR